MLSCELGVQHAGNSNEARLGASLVRAVTGEACGLERGEFKSFIQTPHAGHLASGRLK